MATANDYRSPMLIGGETTVSSERAHEIAVLTGNHIKTVQKWFRVKKFPRAIELLLRLVYGGELGLISPEWDGFWIQRRYGCLVTDQGYSFGPGEVRAWQIRCHQLSHLRQENRRLKRELRDQVRRLSAPGDVDKGHAVKDDGRDAGDREKRAGRAW